MVALAGTGMLQLRLFKMAVEEGVLNRLLLPLGVVARIYQIFLQVVIYPPRFLVEGLALLRLVQPLKLRVRPLLLAAAGVVVPRLARLQYLMVVAARQSMAAAAVAVAGAVRRVAVLLAK
jgi:hypothetical protein